MWDANFNELKEFVSINGFYPSQKKCFIGRWMNTQRKMYKKNNLLIERIKQLESLEGWEWEPIKDSWEKSYKELVDFVKKNNRIPRKPRDTLGEWVTRQRSSYRQKKLSIARTKKLESIKGWKWEMN